MESLAVISTNGLDYNFCPRSVINH